MNINFGINFDGILKFNKSFWVKVGSWAVNQIRSDAQQGIFQTDEPVKKTYSKDYAELKENRMQTKVGTIKSGKNKGKAKFEKIKQFKGVSIVSTNTSFVDMTLTGDTLNSLEISAILPNGVQVAYKPRNIWKIVGNQRPGLNRRIVGLNKKNREALIKIVENQVSQAIKKDFVGKTTINIQM